MAIILTAVGFFIASGQVVDIPGPVETAKTNYIVTHSLPSIVGSAILALVGGTLLTMNFKTKAWIRCDSVCVSFFCRIVLQVCQRPICKAWECRLIICRNQPPNMTSVNAKDAEWWGSETNRFGNWKAAARETNKSGSRLYALHLKNNAKQIIIFPSASNVLVKRGPAYEV